MAALQVGSYGWSQKAAPYNPEPDLVNWFVQQEKLSFVAMCLAEDEPPPRGEKMRSPRAELAGAIEHARISVGAGISRSWPESAYIFTAGLVCGVCSVTFFFPPKPHGPCLFVVLEML
jgi:hypothetical protein